MAYQPVLQTQLGRGIPVPGRTRGSRDCGPRSWQMGIDARTRGRVHHTIAWLRARGRVPGPVPTSIDDAKRAIDGIRVPGRGPLRYYRRRTVAAARKAVRAGYPLQLGIDYGAWNKSQRRHTGDPRFTGGHSVLVFGQRVTDHGVIQWHLFDPLEDHRRPEIPRGPRWVDRKDLIAAAVELAGGRRDAIYAGVIAGGR